MTRSVAGVTALAVAMRKGCPAKPPSPTKSPGPKMATTASLPVLETTDSFTPPLWMYMTLPQASPWEKMGFFLLNSTIFLATPAESRKACASKFMTLEFFPFFVVFILRSYISSLPTAPPPEQGYDSTKSLVSSSLYWTGAGVINQLRPVAIRQDATARDHDS